MSDNPMIPQKIADRIAAIEQQSAILRRDDEVDDEIIREGEYIQTEAYDRIRATEPRILEAQNRKRERGKKQAALQKDIDTIKWVADAFHEEFAARLANADPVTPEPTPAADQIAVRDRIVKVLSDVKKPLTATEIRSHDPSLPNLRLVGGVLSGLQRAGKAYIDENRKWALAAANPEPAPVTRHNATQQEETNSQAIIRVLSEAKQPLSARQIAEHGSLVIGSVNTTLSRLRGRRLIDRAAPGLWMIR